LFGFYVQWEWGDDERGEEQDMVFQVSCVLYILSNEGYKYELVSDRWVGTKDIQVAVIQDREQDEGVTPHTFDQTMPECLRNMSLSLAKKLDMVNQ
jgi:hypothetical protein